MYILDVFEKFSNSSIIIILTASIFQSLCQDSTLFLIASALFCYFIIFFLKIL